jgi:Xaa-Pro dipeptidase
MTLHVMLGMWMDGWGIELSETVAVTQTGVECLTQFDRDLISVR